jgi:hypothetical protein
VIPAHHSLNGLTSDVSRLELPDRWVNDQEKVHHADVRRLDSADLTLNAAELKGSITGFVTLGTTLRRIEIL